MASKEAENYYKKVGLMYTGKECDNFHREELKAAFDAGVESEKKKYEWHELMYNRLDLPKNDELVLVKKQTHQACLSYDLVLFINGLWTKGDDIVNSVIAWKEIE